MILVDVADGDDLGIGATKDLIEVPAGPVIAAADVSVAYRLLGAATPSRPRADDGKT